MDYILQYIHLSLVMEATSIDDVMFYVDNKNISCDSVKLMEAVKAGSAAETTVKVSEESQLECSEFADYRISSDCMRVEACFYPPFENGGMLDKDEIIRDLQHIGVTYGVDEEVIDSFLKTGITAKPIQWLKELSR